MGVTVRLPRDRRPAFPLVCVRCGAEHPGEVHDPTRGWLELMGGKGMSVADRRPQEALQPACRWCDRLMRVGAMARAAILLVLAVVIFVGVIMDHGRPHGNFVYTWYGYSVVGCAVWLGAWWVLPRAVRIRAAGSKYVYTFRNRGVGRAFEELNGRE